MQDFFRCDAGYEARADVVATTSCKKLVVDMHYEQKLRIPNIRRRALDVVKERAGRQLSVQ